jgi:hypothetical protein
MPAQDSAALDAHAGAAPKPGRSFVARHGAGLCMGATALALLALATALLPRRRLEAPPAPPAHWFDRGLHGQCFASLGGYALSGIAEALFALVQVPWRLATGKAVSGLDCGRLAAEFAPAEFAKRPPPSLVAIASELQLGTIAWGLLCAAGLAVGIAFAGLGTEIFIGEHGAFSGAGITAVWPRD